MSNAGSLKGKVRVTIDDRTSIYISPDKDPEEAKRRFLDTLVKSPQGKIVTGRNQAKKKDESEEEFTQVG